MPAFGCINASPRQARFQRPWREPKTGPHGNGSLPSRPRGKLLVGSTDEVVFFNFADMDRIEAASYYARLHINNVTQLLRRSLPGLEGDLADNQAARIHRLIIVDREQNRVSGPDTVLPLMAIADPWRF